jgi:hypothetical protein
MMEEKITREDYPLIKEAIIDEFRKYGYKAIPEYFEEGAEETNSITFKAEIPTGMASFSQSKVEMGAKIYKTGTVHMTISYEHYGGGRNGYSRDYVAIPNEKWGKPTFFQLIDSKIFRDVVDYSDLLRHENKSKEKANE